MTGGSVCRSAARVFVRCSDGHALFYVLFVGGVAAFALGALALQRWGH